MGTLNLSTIVDGAKNAMTKHSPEILTGIGIAGMITTTIMAVGATPKALMCIDDARYDAPMSEKFTTIDKIKACWKCYVPAAITGCLSITCLITASASNVRRNTALATAYSISENALRDYQKKVVDTIGEKKEKAIQDDIAKDKLGNHPVVNSEVILTEQGNTLCYDPISGRYFKSDIEKIRKAINILNRQMMEDMYVSLNEFYYEISLSNTKTGNDVGWSMNDGLIDMRFSSQLSENDVPCLVLDYTITPKHNYTSNF